MTISGDELTVKEVYGVTPDSPMIKNHVITIKNKTLKYENTKEKYERRQDLGGINITATLISSPPFLIVPPGQPEKSFGHQVHLKVLVFFFNLNEIKCQSGRRHEGLGTTFQLYNQVHHTQTGDFWSVGPEWNMGRDDGTSCNSTS